MHYTENYLLVFKQTFVLNRFASVVSGSSQAKYKHVRPSDLYFLVFFVFCFLICCEVFRPVTLVSKSCCLQTLEHLGARNCSFKQVLIATSQNT